jgi:hypothetical protein
LGDVIKRLKDYLARNPYPHTLILHIGTCNIFKEKQHVIRGLIEDVLGSVRELLPYTRVIWSDILLRTKYKGETNEGAGKSTVINLNKSALKVCKGMVNAHVIRSYQAFNHKDDSLYDEGGLHLSPEGNQAFRELLGKALVFFNAHPENKVYTAAPAGYGPR